MNQKEFEERIKSPAIQEMILSHQIGGVAYELSKLYLYGNLYIADEFMLECRTL